MQPNLKINKYKITDYTLIKSIQEWANSDKADPTFNPTFVNSLEKSENHGLSFKQRASLQRIIKRFEIDINRSLTIENYIKSL